MSKFVLSPEQRDNLLIIWGVSATALCGVAMFALVVLLVLLGKHIPLTRTVILYEPPPLESVMAPATPPDPEPTEPQVAKRQVKPKPRTKPSVPKPAGINYRMSEPGLPAPHKGSSPSGTVIQDLDSLGMPRPKVSREDAVGNK